MIDILSSTCLLVTTHDEMIVENAGDRSRRSDRTHNVEEDL
jgi:hypothetical protein